MKRQGGLLLVREMRPEIIYLLAITMDLLIVGVVESLSR